jgi:hypothetical protein
LFIYKLDMDIYRFIESGMHEDLIKYCNTLGDGEMINIIKVIEFEYIMYLESKYMKNWKNILPMYDQFINILFAIDKYADMLYIIKPLFVCRLLKSVPKLNNIILTCEQKLAQCIMGRKKINIECNNSTHTKHESYCDEPSVWNRFKIMTSCFGENTYNVCEMNGQAKHILLNEQTKSGRIICSTCSDLIDSSIVGRLKLDYLSYAVPVTVLIVTDWIPLYRQYTKRDKEYILSIASNSFIIRLFKTFTLTKEDQDMLISKNIDPHSINHLQQAYR